MRRASRRPAGRGRSGQGFDSCVTRPCIVGSSSIPDLSPIAASQFVAARRLGEEQNARHGSASSPLLLWACCETPTKIRIFGIERRTIRNRSENVVLVSPHFATVRSWERVAAKQFG